MLNEVNSPKASRSAGKKLYAVVFVLVCFATINTIGAKFIAKAMEDLMIKKYYAIILAVLFFQIVGCQKENGITSPEWVLSGKIVFNPSSISFDSIFMLDLNSPELPLLTVVPNGGEPRVNSAGTTIVYDAVSPKGRYNIYSVSLSGGAPNNLTNQTIGSDSWPDWSPDGNSIVFDRVYLSVPKSAICVINNDGSNLHTLTDTAFLASAHMSRWSPDGNKIAFVGRVELNSISNYNLYTIFPDGSNLQLLDQNIYVIPRWSSDSQKIAFGKTYLFSSDTTGGGIFIVDVNSKVIRNLNRGLTLIPTGFSWLSNDCLICVRDYLTGTGYQVYRVPISSNGSNTLIAAGFKSIPTTFTSPDGRFIGIFGQKDSDNTLCLYIANSDGTNFHKLKDTGLNASILQNYYYSQWIK